MARITVEDCIRRVPNHFDLVLLAAERARQLHRGSRAAVPVSRDEPEKPPVIALREIAADVLSLDSLHDSLLHTVKSKPVPAEETATDPLEPLGEEELRRMAEAEAADLMAEEESGLDLAGEIEDEESEAETDLDLGEPSDSDLAMLGGEDAA